MPDNIYSEKGMRREPNKAVFKCWAMKASPDFWQKTNVYLKKQLVL